MSTTPAPEGARHIARAEAAVADAWARLAAAAAAEATDAWPVWRLVDNGGSDRLARLRREHDRAVRNAERADLVWA